MTQEFFRLEMKKITDTFGAAEYPPLRMELIWNCCKRLPDNNFAWIVKHFMLTKQIKYPPLPNDFLEKANEQEMQINGGTRGPRSDVFDLQPPGETLQKILKDTGVTSIVEMIEKRKRGQV